MKSDLALNEFFFFFLIPFPCALEYRTLYSTILSMSLLSNILFLVVTNYECLLVLWASMGVISVATVKTSTFEKCFITGAINYVKL
jgi:hypothetical protein